MVQMWELSCLWSQQEIFRLMGSRRLPQRLSVVVLLLLTLPYIAYLHWQTTSGNTRSSRLDERRDPIEAAPVLPLKPDVAPCTPQSPPSSPPAIQPTLQTPPASKPPTSQSNATSADLPTFPTKAVIAQKYAFLQYFVATHESILHSFTAPPLAVGCVGEPNADSDIPGPVPPLRVIYFISFIPKRFWATKFIVEHQLVELALFGLADSAELHFVVQTPDPSNIMWLKELVARLKLPPIRYYFLERNLWEFAGVHLVWELACRDDNPNTLYLYMHSKGASRMTEGERWREEMVAYHEVVYPWRAIVRLFLQTNKTIETVGFVSSPQGWQWFNMWWARGSYLRRMSEPGIALSQRYYYEYYLAQHLSDDMIHNVTRNGSHQRVGSHCVTARKIFDGVESPPLLQSTYNYQENTPPSVFEQSRVARGAYSLKSCSNSGIHADAALATIYDRCFFIRNPKPRCGFEYVKPNSTSS